MPKIKNWIMTGRRVWYSLKYQKELRVVTTMTGRHYIMFNDKAILKSPYRKIAVALDDAVEFQKRNT